MESISKKEFKWLGSCKISFSISPLAPSSWINPRVILLYEGMIQVKHSWLILAKCHWLLPTPTVDLGRRFYTTKHPLKVSCFRWLVSKEASSLDQTIQRRQMQLCSRCPLCERTLMNTCYLFPNCKITYQIFDMPNIPPCQMSTI